MKTLFLFFCVLWITLSLASKHPHGTQISIVFGGDDQQVNYERLKKVLLNPEIQDRKVVVLSIIGAYRRGKSFFLNYCLRYLYGNYKSINTQSTFVKKENWWGDVNEPLTGFSWAPGSKADTKGILIWSDVFLLEQNNQKIAIILIDTQGLFELGRSSIADAKVFGITSLISSIQILNLQGVIQENELEYLKLVTDFTKAADMRQKENAVDNGIKPFQKILFLVRDWSDDKVGFGYDGGKKYLTTVLNAEGKNNSAETVRGSIKNSYQQLNAFLMPYPSKKAVTSTYDGRWSELDEDFQEHLKNLITSLLSPKNLIVKRIFNNDITANDLMSHIPLLFKIFHSSDLSDMGIFLNVIATSGMKFLTDRLLTEYKEQMQDRVSMLDYINTKADDCIYEDHKILQNKMITEYRKAPKMCDKNMENGFENHLIRSSNDIYYEMADYVNLLHKTYERDNKEKLQKERERLRQRMKEIETSGFLHTVCKIFSLGLHDCDI